MPIFRSNKLLVYIPYTLALLFLNKVLPQLPFGTCLCFALLSCGGNLYLTPLLLLLASLIKNSSSYWLCSAIEGAFLSLLTFLYRRSGKKMKWECLLYLITGWLPYYFLCPWHSTLIANAYVGKGVGILWSLAFCYACYRTIYCLLFRLCRCKLRDAEKLCCAVVFTLCGMGSYLWFGAFFYTLFALMAVGFFVRLYRDANAVILAVVLSLPLALLQGIHGSALLVISALVDLFLARTGKWTIPLVNGVILAFVTLYVGGVEAWQLVLRWLLTACGSTIIALPTDEQMTSWQKTLCASPLLPQHLIETERARTGEQLYRMAQVFKEMENAFCQMDDGLDEEGAKKRMLEELKQRACQACERKDKCVKSSAYRGFARLIATGCLKGKVNLIDVPSDLTATCNHPTEVITIVNGLLAEYRRCLLDRENAKSGRMLLAGQANGVANVMKSIAVSLCHTDRSLQGWDDVILQECLSRGVDCNEVHVAREGREITLVLSHDAPIKEVSSALQTLCGQPYILKDKCRYDDLKGYYRFVCPPRYDALFGIATLPKQGEALSGDTHSVIHINEHCFLMVLSDGMGSGAYAHQVSATAISLIESFYRAQMPRETVLNTINKVLSFNRDERFACIDIVAIDLQTGNADFVKIGSPAGLIIRQNEMKVLQATGLPLGILDHLHPTVCSEALQADDMVVFMSDGITSAFGSDTELIEYLQTLHPMNPQTIADTLLQEALNKMGGTPLDDMTVLCTRLFSTQ